MDSNQILHTSKYHEIGFMGSPETWQTNPRWRTTTILKNGKIQYLSNRDSNQILLNCKDRKYSV